jgi:hypothetical protein
MIKKQVMFIETTELSEKSDFCLSLIGLICVNTGLMIA